MSTNVEVYRSKWSSTKSSEGRRKVCQPYILWLTNDLNTGQFYIKVEGHTLHLGGDFLPAFERLLKFHFVFDTSYETNLTSFWEIIEYMSGMDVVLTATQIEFLTILEKM